MNDITASFQATDEQAKTEVHPTATFDGLSIAQEAERLDIEWENRNPSNVVADIERAREAEKASIIDVFVQAAQTAEMDETARWDEYEAAQRTIRESAAEKAVTMLIEGRANIGGVEGRVSANEIITLAHWLANGERLEAVRG